jgi:hypothetical protein
VPQARSAQAAIRRQSRAPVGEQLLVFPQARAVGGRPLLHDLRAVKARSVFLSLWVQWSSRIFRLIAIPAGLAVERVTKDIAVADADHLPRRAPGAEQVALAVPDASFQVPPGSSA